MECPVRRRLLHSNECCCQPLLRLLIGICLVWADIPSNFPGMLSCAAPSRMVAASSLQCAHHPALPIQEMDHQDCGLTHVVLQMYFAYLLYLSITPFASHSPLKQAALMLQRRYMLYSEPSVTPLFFKIPIEIRLISDLGALCWLPMPSPRRMSVR